MSTELIITDNEQQPTPNVPAPVPQQKNGFPEAFATENGFALIQRVGQALSEGTIVPTKFQGNISNCIIAVNAAAQMGVDPFTYMQNVDIIGGKPTLSAKFMMALFNSSGRFTPIRFEECGTPNDPSWGFRAYATEISTGEVLKGSFVTLKMAKDDGWTRNSKWTTMPEIMLRYRAATFFIRAYAPELLFGYHTTEEMEDVKYANKKVAEDASMVERIKQRFGKNNEPEEESDV